MSRLIQHAVNRKFYFEFKGKNEPIIFLHGFLGSKMNWLTFSRILNEKHQHTVYALDMPLHGELQKFPINHLTYENMAQFVIEFMQHVNIECCHLVGHSMGGRTAAYTALTNNNNNNKIKSLTLVDIALNKSVEASTKAIVDSLVQVTNEQLEKFSNKNEIAHFLDGKIPKNYLDFLLQNLTFDREKKKYNWGFDTKKIKDSYEHIKNFDTDAVKGRTFSPVLLAYGENSKFVQIPEDVDHLSTFFNNLLVRKISKAGHLVQIDNRQELMEQVVEFIRNQTNM